MASFILSKSFLVLLLALISPFSRISISEAKSSFSFSSSRKNASFESDDIALYGDAKLVDGGSSIQLTDSVNHGGGRVVYKKPIEFFNTKSAYPLSLGTVFSFSTSPDRAGRFGFVMFPANGTFDHSLVEVKFNISENFTKFRDWNVVVIVNGTMVYENRSNLTIVDLKKKEKEKLLLYAWIDYQAATKFLYVWLSKSKSLKSVEPMFSSRLDSLKYEDVFMVGLNSYSGNLRLHSWSFKASTFPRSIHSYALILRQKYEHEEAAKRRRRKRMLEIVTYIVMTFGSTGLVFFAVMRLWAALKRNNLGMMMPEECGVKTKEFEYEKMEKIKVVMSNDVKQERL